MDGNVKVKNSNVLKSILYILKKVFEYDPVSAFLIILQNLINAFIPTVQVIVVAHFINTALDCVKNGRNISNIYLYIFELILVVGTPMLLDKMITFFNLRLTNRLRIGLSEELIEKYSRLSYKHIEDYKAAELVERLFKTPEEKMMEGYSNFVHFGYLVILIISIMSVIAIQVKWAAVLIIVSAVPLFYLSIKSGKANYAMNRETTKYIRRYGYIGEVLTTRNYVEERSLFGYSQNLNEVWVENYENARKQIFHTELKWWAKVKLGGILTVLVSLIITLALIPQTIKGAISIGMFMSLINATYSLVNRMGMELASTMDKLVQSTELVVDKLQFDGLSETEGAIELPLDSECELKSLEFRNVRFKYPNTDKYILDGMSFKIEQGKHYSVVGLNGAGKTTITKLITGLYDEFEGDILINNKSIREYSLAQLKGISAIAYQDFAKYFVSIRDNILLGNLRRQDIKDNEIYDILRVVDADDVVKNLENGLDTLVGKVRSKSVDLSGGQWQKIALARFVLNNAPLKILDEPTSALDPISESKIYEQFDEICKKHTTIFISHRLGSTKLADEIFVIDQGKVVESGTHVQLMEQKGIYSDLYRNQRSWYM